MGMGQEMLEDGIADQSLADILYEDWLNQQEEEWDEDYIPTSWTSADGETRLIKDMETSHIRNCIAWIKKNHPSNPHTLAMVQAFGAELDRRQPKPARYHSLD